MVEITKYVEKIGIDNGEMKKKIAAWKNRKTIHMTNFTSKEAIW